MISNYHSNLMSHNIKFQTDEHIPTAVILGLQQRGVDVLTIQGYELARGGGGPHCMTLPILRQKY